MKRASRTGIRLRGGIRSVGGLMKLIWFAVAMLGIATAGTEGQKSTPANTDDDPVLHAMRVEMERSKSQLKLDGVQAPYYIEYRIVDMNDRSAEAMYGALRSLAHNHARLIRVVVRVGDYKQDSYFGAGEGVVQMAPLDDDVPALRHQLWLATDGAYKAASEALAAKQAQLKQLNVDQPVDDFARAPALESVAPVIRADFNTQPWQAALEEASGLYRSTPEIEYLSAVFRFIIANRYFVNSEGTVVRGGRGIYFLYASGAIQAADGMRLERSYGDAVTDLGELSREIRGTREADAGDAQTATRSAGRG